MLLPSTINKIQISNFTQPKGGHFSINSGLLVTFPFKINDEELDDVYCENCPIYQYRQDTINSSKGSDRRQLIRCAGQIVRQRMLGPIHISEKCKISNLNYLFRFEDATPCGIYLNTLSRILQSPRVGIPQKGVKLGDI